MDATNADSDHSMTWEDFFGSTTDLTPTLIGIYDSFLEPKNSGPGVSRFDLTAKDARNDPPLDPKPPDEKHKENNTTMDVGINISISPPKEPSKITGGVKLPGFSSINKSSLYTLRTKLDSAKDSDNLGAINDSVIKNVLISSDSAFSNSKSSIYKSHLKSFKNDKVADITTTPTVFDLSPNVKRMISSATETSTGIKFQKKSVNVVRSSIRGHKSNIPLVGATSKISQSGVEILPTVEIYEQSYGIKITNKPVENDKSISSDSLVKTVPVKPEFRLDADHTTYDVPSNKQAIYDVPTHNNKTAFESLSLPYIDQSIELSITSNDREFDTKLASKDNSPDKPKPVKVLTPEISPTKIPLANSGTNSLHRKDFATKCDSATDTSIYPETVGSTGNLKHCSILEKENRLHPPTVEVSRPLSMSSIASSSSTSSSGPQHKGGVNSAYLASIESLDDHSDADITSANGSNNFVNNAGVIKALPEDRHGDSIPQFQTDELIGLSQLERVCAEIVQTENVYVEDLRQVVEGYQHVWRNESVFSEEELNDLFNNIEDIYTFNRSFCEELNSCSLEATSLAKCFVNNNTGFTVYTSYCTGYPRTMERLAVLASRPHSARVFRERQTALGHPLPLASYLLKPVQRILKYHLLLQNVVKLCACNETESALLKMTSIAQYIDDMKRKHEHAVRVQEIQSLLYGWVGPDLTTYGELCAEGTFRVFGAKAMRHVFLFDKMILITKNREDGILAYKSHIMCNNMMLVESIAGAPLSFHVIPWDAPKSQITLQATSHRHKREWTLLLKRVILENYNAVIPSHARQLVMELGQNKTDDDILAEKSHNLITQSSMRKQLSAPEYLEKRKLDRERRKSFENGIRGRLKKSNRKIAVPVTQNEVAQVIVCDCSQISEQKGIDYTCDNCYVDLCSDCETEVNNKDKNIEEKCSCKDDNQLSPEKCPECDRSLHYIDSGSAEHIERKQSCCKCSDFKSSQESVGKEFTGSLNKNRGYHSSDNIVNYNDKVKSKEDLSDTNNSSLSNIRNIPKTCLKCAKIKENIVVSSSNSTIRSRKSRLVEQDKKSDTLRSKSKDDPQRVKLSKIGTWRRKSEPGLQQNAITIVTKKTSDNEIDKNIEIQGNEKIEFECRNCGSNKISRKNRSLDGSAKSGVEIKMYNSKNIPKKISKLKKNRAKTLRHGPDSTAKFYAELSTDVSTENILHISESTDSINVVDKENEIKNIDTNNVTPNILSKDEDIDEETYKKLIEKTDSFKKNELEKVKYLNKQKVITEGSEVESESQSKQEIAESCEETEEPLEQIISQLLMQNREFQKLLKKQQLRNTAQRRHQRLLKSHSNPEPLLIRNSEQYKIKPKYDRQMSENLDCRKDIEYSRTDVTLSPPNEEKESDEDHIYETLRVVAKKVEIPVESPKLPIKRLEKAPESDYVYLSFDQLNKIKENQDGIYDVPIKRTVKVENKDKKPIDYYVTINKPLPRPDLSNVKEENVYDNVLDVCGRQKEPTELKPGEYLPMSSEQNPNTPEIWLSRQKEHFNVSRDRKSGSLPRSFQIVTSSSEEQNLSTFRNKPNNNNKTYLNRDGKVLSTDRPFTIASDKSELSFEDVENYMSDGDILKFNKSPKHVDSEEGSMQNISQSTLELEEEIDRCYKNNFEKINLDANKNESVLTVSQSNLVISATSSCEVLMAEKIKNNNDAEIIHPEHKIYKPTSNMLSLKNVLSRFKNKNSNKNTSLDQTEINANEPSSPDSTSSDLKSPTNEKRSGLNPRSYSKNLLQRFRNIIGDEQTDDGRTEKTNKNEDFQTKSPLKNKIKVVITSTDTTPMSTSTVYSTNNDLSRSVCNTTTLSESQNEKNNLDVLSHSCDDIIGKKSESRPIYEKSISMITNSSNAPSPSKSSSYNSFQNLNKLPIYMQGSKHLGARIAQPDYVDPTTLMKDIKSDVNNVNVLINKNAVRPDSLFSNSSFVTTSSEGTYQEPVLKTDKTDIIKESKLDMSGSIVGLTCDENFYEKSFEKIEQLTDEDVFRDSAVYSDQEEGDEIKTHRVVKSGNLRNEILKVESFKRSSSFRTSETLTSTTKIENKSSLQTRVTVTGTKLQIEKVLNGKEQRSQIGNTNILRSKIAPPVPVKPKLTSTHSINEKSSKPLINKYTNFNKKVEESSESTNVRTIKRNASYKQTYSRSESTPTTQVVLSKCTTDPKQNIDKNEDKSKTDTLSRLKTETSSNFKSSNSNIHIKRLSFERASLDSATRKLKTHSDIVTDLKRSSTEIPKSTSKTVLERRMEIESMAKNVPNKLNKKPSQIAKPTSITNKMATFEKTVKDDLIKKDIASTSTDQSNIPTDKNSIFDTKDNLDAESKESWVKQVVNKFQ